MNIQTEKHIPDFEGHEEEAEYWGTHDSADFEWEPAEMTVTHPLRLTCSYSPSRRFGRVFEA